MVAGLAVGGWGGALGITKGDKIAEDLRKIGYGHSSSTGELKLLEENT